MKTLTLLEMQGKAGQTANRYIVMYVCVFVCVWITLLNYVSACSVSLII